MTTKKQVDEVYARPIDPAKAFERLSMLMDYAIGQLKETKEKKVQESAHELHSALSCFYPESEVQANKRLSDALEIVLDDLFEKAIPIMKNCPDCKGTGRVTFGNGFPQYCPNCTGKGEIPDNLYIDKITF